MIGPTTRVFGVVAIDAQAHGHVARLYNYLFGFNGLDAAYLSFFVRPEVLHFTLTGFATSGTAEVLHFVPPHQTAAGAWTQLGGRVHASADPIDTLSFAPIRGALAERDASRWLAPEAICARALSDARAWFSAPIAPPPDWLAVVGERTFRPCQLTHDDAGRHHGRSP